MRNESEKIIALNESIKKLEYKSVTINDPKGGTIICYVIGNDVKIHSLHVPVARRKQGVARAMMNELISQLKGRTLWLESFSMDQSFSKEALSMFYESLGFRMVGIGNYMYLEN